MAAPQQVRRKTITQDLESEWYYRGQGALWGGLVALACDWGVRDGWLGPLAGAILQLPGQVWYVLFSSH